MGAARNAIEADLRYSSGGFVLRADLAKLPSHTVSAGVTFIPQNVRLEPGMNSGWVLLRWKGDGKGSLYEVQSCTGDPTVEANWTYRGSFSGGRAELKGFTPGALMWGRVRKIGTGGEVGGWSDPAQIRVV